MLPPHTHLKKRIFRSTSPTCRDAMVDTCSSVMCQEINVQSWSMVGRKAWYARSGLPISVRISEIGDCFGGLRCLEIFKIWIILGCQLHSLHTNLWFHSAPWPAQIFESLSAMDSDDDFEAWGNSSLLGHWLWKNLRIGTPHSILEILDVLDSSRSHNLFILWNFEAFKAS